MSYKPRDSSHQPVDDAPLFSEQFGSFGRPSHPSPSSSLENGQRVVDTGDSEALKVLRSIASVISEMQGMRSEIEFYQASNHSLVEELFAAHCPELAEQKKVLSDSEKLIAERLERLQSGWTFDDVSSPWKLV